MIDMAEYHALTNKLRQGLGIASTVTSIDAIKEEVNKAIDTGTLRNNLIPVLDKWLIIADLMQNPNANKVTAVRRQTKEIIVNTTITADQYDSLSSRLKEIELLICKRQEFRGVELTKQIIEEAELTEEAYRIHCQLDETGKGSNFWIWVSEKVGYHPNFIRMTWKVLRAMKGWQGDLPALKGGMIPELARLPLEYVEPVLRKEIKSDSGLAYDELPITSTDKAKETLQTLVTHLREKFRQEEKVKNPNSERLVKSTRRPPAEDNEPTEALLEGTEKYNDRDDGIPGVTKEGRQGITGPKAGSTYINSITRFDIGISFARASETFKTLWNSRKKSLADALDSGDVSEEGMRELKKICDLCLEISDVLTQYV